jgi:hypothetical protein
MWVNPHMTPANGNTVLVRDGDSGKLETWPCNAKDAHVVVLAEMA